MQIIDAIQHFGQTSEHPALNAWLNSIGIAERPVFEENPMHWISNKEQGYILMFHTPSSYKRLWGEVVGNGSMALTRLRIHAQENSDGFSEFRGALPWNLSFNMVYDDVKKILGPADKDQQEEDEDRVCTWKKLTLGEKDISISIIFHQKSGQISFLNITPVKLEHR